MTYKTGHRNDKNRSLFIPQLFLKLDCLSPSDKFAISIIFNLSRISKKFYASNEYIAKYAGISESSVKRSLSKLKRLGFIKSKIIKGQRYITIVMEKIQMYNNSIQQTPNINNRQHTGSKISIQNKHQGQPDNLMVQNKSSACSKLYKCEGQNGPLLKIMNKNELKIGDVINSNDNFNLIEYFFIEIYPNGTFLNEEIKAIKQFCTFLSENNQIGEFKHKIKFLPQYLKFSKSKPPSLCKLIGSPEKQFMDGYWNTVDWKNESQKAYNKAIS